jgi:hypothetical protein
MWLEIAIASIMSEAREFSHLIECLFVVSQDVVKVSIPSPLATSALVV